MNGERILIFRPDNIGDVLLFSGALEHIRNLYPRAHITLAVQSHIINFVELCPFVDCCISVDKLSWLGRIKGLNIRCIDEFRGLIRKTNRLSNLFYRPFDIVIYPVRSPSVSQLKIVHDLGAENIYGISGCDANAPRGGFPPKLHPKNMISDCMDVSNFESWRHELITTLDFLRFLGCEISLPEEIKPQLWLSGSEKNYLNDVERQGAPIIGLFPGGSFSSKCWNAKNYYELTKLIGGEAIYVLFGSLADKDFASQVEIQLRKTCKETCIVNLIGKTTLRELAKNISQCDLFIGMDSSGLHIAISSGIPTIGIATGAHYKRFVPWGDPEKNLILTKQMECFQCNWICNRGDIACMQGVTPVEVAEAAKKLLRFKSSTA